jgi:hypothetical protein
MRVYQTEPKQEAYKSADSDQEIILEITPLSDHEMTSMSDQETALTSDHGTVSMSDQETASASDQEMASMSDQEMALVDDQEPASMGDQEVASMSDQEVAPVDDQEVASMSDQEIAAMSDQEAAPADDQAIASMSDQEIAPTGETDEVAETVPQPPKQQFVDKLHGTARGGVWKKVRSNILVFVMLLFCTWCLYTPTEIVYEDTAASEVVASVNQVKNDTFDLMANANKTFYVMSVLSYSNDWLSVSPDFAKRSSFPDRYKLSEEYTLIVHYSRQLHTELVTYKGAIDQFSGGVEVSLKALLDDVAGTIRFRRPSVINSLWRIFLYADDLADRIDDSASKGRHLCAELKSSLRKIHECGIDNKGPVKIFEDSEDCYFSYFGRTPTSSQLISQKNIHQQLLRVSSLYEFADSLFIEAQSKAHHWQKNHHTIKSHLQRLREDDDNKSGSSEMIPWRHMRQDLMTLTHSSELLTNMTLYGQRPFEKKMTRSLDRKSSTCKNELNMDGKLAEIDLMKCFFDALGMAHYL